MRVGIIGAGRIGGNAARLLAAAGHEVKLSFARDQSKLTALASEIGGQASAGPVAEAAAFGDVVIVSVPWDLIPEALKQAGDLAGKIVVDTTNQFGAGPMPAAGQTAAQFNAARMPGARYTKSFNTLTAEFQSDAAGCRGPARVVQWICGDDAGAKQIVTGLIADAGFAPVDLGGTAGCAVMESPRRAGAVRRGGREEMSDRDAVVSGLVAGVPYMALPPAGQRDGRQPAPLVVAWHLNDPPRSAAAMASALPLAGVAAWRVYLDLPMHGRRQLPGGLEEFMRLGYQDAVLKAFEPQVTQAAQEFPAVLAGLRARLPVTGGPIGVVGASVGALPAQLVITGGAAEVSAAALISPVIQLAEVVAANERRFGVSYPWSEAARAVAARFDFVSRVGDIAALSPQPAILLVTGADDDPAFPLQAQRLHAGLRQRYSDPGRVALTSIPGMGHAFATEPGIEPVPPTAQARLVDAAVTDWFSRYLR